MSEIDNVDLEIEMLIEVLLKKFRYDFRQYSRSSLRRRLENATSRFNVQTISHLQARLLHDASFLSHLLDYLTVGTTEMFRDPEYFRELRENVMPYLKTFPSLKIWIAGCSTGEEVYSLAILLREEGLLEKSIVYATDINVHRLEIAKRGIYSTEIIRKGTENYRLAGGKNSFSEYFTAAYEAAQMDPTLIRNVVFSDHSLSTDEVFAETHLVSCRNVLIYFDRPLQNRAVNLFRDSLVRGGFLGLGSKETLRFLDAAPEFSTVNERERLFQKL